MQFPAAEDLTAQDIVDNKTTLSNVRLWDPDVVKQSFGQLQTIRPYYEFADVDVDRYMVNGQKRQVLISVREINSSLLAEQAQTWVNRHLVYTHGFGLVMSPAAEFDSRGLPQLHHREHPARRGKFRGDRFAGPGGQRAADLLRRGHRRLRGRRHDQPRVRLSQGRDERDVPLQGRRRGPSGLAGQEAGVGDTAGLEPDPVLRVHQAAEPHPDEARPRDEAPGAGTVACSSRTTRTRCWSTDA